MDFLSLGDTDLIVLEKGTLISHMIMVEVMIEVMNASLECSITVKGP